MARPTIIPAELLPKIAELAGRGHTPREIRDWLKEEHGVEVSTDTVRRDVKRAASPAAIQEQLRVLLRQATAVHAGKALRETLVACLNRLTELVKQADLKHIGEVIRAIQVLGELDIAKIALTGEEDAGGGEPHPQPGQQPS